MERMMEMRRTGKTIILSVLSVILAGVWTPAAGYGAESIVITSANVTFKSEFGQGEILEPQISTTTSGLSVKDVIWSHDISKWKAAKSERVSVTLSSESKIFAKSYNRTSCKISGAQFVSAKALDDYSLEVKVDYVPVVTLGTTSQAGWSDSAKTKALWDKVEFATGYQVNLYADDKLVKKISVSTNNADLSSYMDKDAVYYYEVRATGNTSEDKKYLKEGAYVTSEDTVVEFEGDTSGQWKGDTYRQEDGSKAINCWKQVLNDWYYFDAAGNRQKGWLQSGQRWYYMNPADGKMMTGWQFINNKWYYLNTAGGEMMTGWMQTSPGTWYYLYQDGGMAANTSVGGYWVDASGKWIP